MSYECDSFHESTRSDLNMSLIKLRCCDVDNVIIQLMNLFFGSINSITFLNILANP